MRKIIKVLILLTFVLSFSCQKDEVDKAEVTEAYVKFKLDGQDYDFQLLNDGVDNFATIVTTADNTKTVSFFAIDPATMILQEEEQLAILIQAFEYESDKIIYPFYYGDDAVNQASISIFIPGGNENFPDFLSHNGDFYIWNNINTNKYIEGEFWGTFKDTAFWIGDAEYEDLLEVSIEGSYKIFKIQ